MTEKIYDNFKEKVLTLNISLWSLLVTLHGIIISVFAIIISISPSKSFVAIFVLFPLSLVFSLFSIFSMIQNIIKYRDQYRTLAEKFYPKNYENLGPEDQNKYFQQLQLEISKANQKRLEIRQGEQWARWSIIVNFIFISASLILMSK